MQEIVRKVLTARVYDVATQTPLDAMPRLSERLGRPVRLKREDLQPVFSFKLRGAYNKVAAMGDDARRAGVICASAGNHAQGVAVAAARHGVEATVVVPVTTPDIKVRAIRRLGAKVVTHGEGYDEAYEHARAIESETGATFVHPFDDPDVIAGQGTIGMEILRQHPAPIDAIFVAIGGGGLISGVAAYVKQIRPEIRVIGVQTEDSDAMARSLKAGRRIELHDVGLFSDGTAVKKVGEETFRLCRELVDEIGVEGAHARDVFWVD